MTLLGAILFPVALACFFWKPFYLLPLLVSVSVVELGWVYNGAIGSYKFGILPFDMVAAFIGVRLVFLVWRQGSLLPAKGDPFRGFVVLLLAFWAWACLSAFVMPRVFAGMPVYAPREGLDVDINNLAPLQWGLGNVAQAGYLTLDISAALYALYVVRSARQSAQIAKAFYWTVGIVVLAGMFQIISPSHYPYQLFNNNAYYDPGIQQDIGEFHRITSTFGEPSFAGSYLSAVAVGLLAGYLAGRRGLLILFGFLLSITVLVNTTATTGYVAFALSACVLAWYFNPLRRRGESWRVVLKRWAAILWAAGAAIVVLVLNPKLYQAAIAVTVEKIGGLTDKVENGSVFHRLLSDFYALSIVQNTWGLGVGLGSNRPSSLLTDLLSTVGILGTILFAAALYKLLKPLPDLRALGRMQIITWTFLGLLIADMVGIPDLNRPALWGLIVAFIAQVTVYAHSRAAVPLEKTVAAPARNAVDDEPGAVPAT